MDDTSVMDGSLDREGFDGPELDVVDGGPSREDVDTPEIATEAGSADASPTDREMAIDVDDPPPIYAMTDVPARRVFAVSQSTYVTGQDGSFWGWGSNQSGTFQPSDGSSARFGDRRLRPQQIAEHLETREMQFKGGAGICALTNPPDGGAVYCWGVGALIAFGGTDPDWDDWRFPHRMGTHSDVLSLA